MLQRQMGPRQGRMPGPPRGMRGPGGLEVGVDQDLDPNR